MIVGASTRRFLEARVYMDKPFAVAIHLLSNLLFCLLKLSFFYTVRQDFDLLLSIYHLYSMSVNLGSAAFPKA